MKKYTYSCKENDAKIRFWYENNDINELWVQIKGEDSWTVIGYNDLLTAINEVKEKVNNGKS